MEQNEMLEAIIKGVEEKLPEAVNTIVESKMADAAKENEDTVEDIKAEVKKLKENTSFTQAKEWDEAKAKSIIVNTFKSIKENGVSSEEAFSKTFDAQVKATFQNEGIATDGAEFVFDLFSKDVYSIFEDFPLVRELSTLNITGKNITLPRYDWGTEAYWVDEGGNFTASKGDTGNLKIDVYKLGALVTFTDEMLDDGMTNETLYSLIIKEIGVKFANKIENELLNGDQSTGKMKGILTDTGINAKTSAATDFSTITEEDLYDADALIDDKYNTNEANKVAVMLKSTMNSLRTKRDPSTGVLLYPELRTNKPTVIGYKVITTSTMPAEASGAVGVLLGNIKDYYYHVARKGFSSEMGYITGDFQAGKKSLRVDRRDWGAPKDINAFAVVKIS